MTEKFQLPNPAPKGSEHEKWKAMVDSVIEFISASRTMLHVLNERIKDGEKVKEEEKKKLEDEKTKLTFYKECLHLEIKPALDSKLATTDPTVKKVSPAVKESGDGRIKNINEMISVAHQTAESFKELCNASFFTENESRISKESNVSPITDREDQRVTCMQVSPTVEHRQQAPRSPVHSCQKHKSFEKLCAFHKKAESSMKTEGKLQGCTSKESQASCNEQVTREIQYECAEENVNTSPPNEESVAQTPLINSREIPSFQSGITLSKCQKASKIPRTKSCSDDKNKCVLIEKTPNEGLNMGKVHHCSKKCHKESTYSTIHQRNKTPKGDNTTQL